MFGAPCELLTNCKSFSESSDWLQQGLGQIGRDCSAMFENAHIFTGAILRSIENGTSKEVFLATKMHIFVFTATAWNI